MPSQLTSSNTCTSFHYTTSKRVIKTQGAVKQVWCNERQISNDFLDLSKLQTTPHHYTEEGKIHPNYVCTTIPISMTSQDGATPHNVHLVVRKVLTATGSSL